MRSYYSKVYRPKHKIQIKHPWTHDQHGGNIRQRRIGKKKNSSGGDAFAEWGGAGP